MSTIVVLGSGIMATALATPLTDNGHEVRLVGTHLDRDIIASIQTTGVHPGSTSRCRPASRRTSWKLPQRRSTGSSL